MSVDRTEPTAAALGLPDRDDLDDRAHALRVRVHAACNALAERGERVSTRSARLGVGGGHPNDINPWVAEWKTLHEVEKANLAALDQLPEATRQAIDDKTTPLIGQIWTLARGAANAEIERLRQAFDAEQQDTRVELADLQALVEDLSEEKTALEAERDTALVERDAGLKSFEIATAREADAKRAAQEATAALTTVQETLAQLKGAAEQKAQQLQSQAQTLKDLQKRLDTEQEQQLELEKRFAALQADRDQHQQAAQAAIEERDAARTAAQNEREALQRTLDDAKAAQQTLREELSALRGQLLSQNQLQALLERGRDGDGDRDRDSNTEEPNGAPDAERAAVTCAGAVADVIVVPARAKKVDAHAPDVSTAGAAAKLQATATAELARLIDVALLHWPALADTVVNGQPWRRPTLHWYERGLSAGKAFYASGEIHLSWPLGLQDTEQLLTDTLPHELAHIVAGRLAGNAEKRVRPHGPEWQSVATRLAGRPLAVGHTLDTSAVKARVGS